jgi:hypothetical protein
MNHLTLTDPKRHDVYVTKYENGKVISCARVKSTGLIQKRHCERFTQEEWQYAISKVTGEAINDPSS